ncbi:hypothetical protein IH575_04900 [Candidatus Dojkabacteria bacterium]|nr:hypothetical protein [Candidatus Dojkabacteria bacterium]
MRKHWEERLGNVSNKALEKTWRQLAGAFIEHVKAHDDPNGKDHWTVLSPPTGSGKTQGTILYCAMLSEGMKGAPEHPGVLIVTKLIDDADIIAGEINLFSRRFCPELPEGAAVAVAYHSKNKLEHRRESLKDFPVLVITHKAYEMALDNLDLDAPDTAYSIPTTWTCFHAFNEGKRKLVIVDEAIDLVVESQLDGTDMRRLYGLLSEDVRKRFPIEMLFLDELKDFFEKAPKITQGTHIPNEMFHGGEAALDVVMAIADEMEKSEEVRKEVLDRAGPLPPLDISHANLFPGRPFPYFRGLREELRSVRLDKELWMEDTDINRKLYRKIDSILSDSDALYRQWRWYTKAENRDTLNTARLLVPDNIKGAVVMDATAGENVFYEIFDQAKRIPPIPGTRRYNNVTLHTSINRNHRVGKISMRDNAEEVCGQLVSNLEKWAKGHSILIITHLDVEDELKNQIQKLTEKEDCTIKTAHWGDINGSNEWRDTDTVIIFGLPYRPDTWPVNAYMACQGPQDTEWMAASGDRPFKDYLDIKEALIVGQLVTDVIQGTNRICCRKVIDVEGNCPQADIYILLPTGSRSEAIREGIRGAMPGLKVKKWIYSGTKHEPRRTMYEEDLVHFLVDSGAGKISAAAVVEGLGIPHSTFDRLVRRARDKNNPQDTLVQALVAAGYTYEVKPEGSTRRAYFISTSEGKKSEPHITH